MQTRDHGLAGPAGEADETPRHRALATASRAAILRLVRSADAGLTAADIVARVGLHPSTVRAHLEHLVDAGLLMKARASDGSPGRPAWRYRAAPDPAPKPYRTLADALLEHLGASGDAVAAATEAGMAWGRRLAADAAPGASPVDTTLAVLRELGFDPQRHPDPQRPANVLDTIHLHTCPYLDLVGKRPDVMCALHAGMISGVVQAAGASQVRVVLEPFAAPTACVARLATGKRRAKPIRVVPRPAEQAATRAGRARS